MPAAFVNKTGQPLPGIRHRTLGGMAPEDAIKMLYDMGIQGNKAAIRRYLKENFDNHPLIVGIVGGLVADYVRDPGNFDVWVADPQGGAALHMARLELKQRRTHILARALYGLEQGVRRLLSFIAALGYSVPFDTIVALNPFSSDSNNHHQTSLDIEDSKAPEALPRLVAALQELERRGLLQWDRQKNRYDLHPVVRGFAFDALEKNERAEISNRIVDHFVGKPSDRYSELQTLADAQQSITIVRALIHADRFDDATKVLLGDFGGALMFSIEEYNELLALLRPMFPNGFQRPPKVRAVEAQSSLLNEAGLSLRGLHRLSEARASFIEELRLDLSRSADKDVAIGLFNLAQTDIDDNRIARALGGYQMARVIAETIENGTLLLKSRVSLIVLYGEIGRVELAELEYVAARQLPVPGSRAVYRPGDIETALCWLRFYQASLTSTLLDEADAAAQSGRNRPRSRALCRLRGELSLLNNDPSSAITEFERAIEMAQIVDIPAADVEGRLALAKAQSGETRQAVDICNRLRGLPDPPHLELAETAVQLGIDDGAREHALSAYRFAWADGPQYSRWWQLRRCRDVFQALGEPEPSLPAYDPATAEPFPYEREIRALIEKVREQKHQSRR